jgi:hypothetical protein
MSHHRFNGRAFLRGTSVSTGLPWMESGDVRGDEPESHRKGEGWLRRDWENVRRGLQWGWVGARGRA